MRPLTDLKPDGIRAFAAEVRSWPDELARYKGRYNWSDCVLKYYCRTICREAAGDHW